MTKMDWSKARRRPTQSSRDDDQDDAASKWLAQRERQQASEGKIILPSQQADASDGVQWGPWRPFKRATTEGWERDGVRRPASTSK